VKFKEVFDLFYFLELKSTMGGIGALKDSYLNDVNVFVKG